MRKKAERSRQSGSCTVQRARVPIAEKKSMKKMNKVAAVLLAVAMAGSMAVPAFAAPEIGQSGGTPKLVEGNSSEGNVTSDTDVYNKVARSTVVSYSIDSSFEWSVPTNIVFESNSGDVTKKVTKETDGTGTTGAVNQDVIVSNSVLLGSYALGISVNSVDWSEETKGDFKLQYTDRNHVTSTIMYTVTPENGKEISADSSDEDKQFMTLPAGQLTDSKKLTFTLDRKVIEDGHENDTAVIAGDYTGKAVFVASCYYVPQS